MARRTLTQLRAVLRTRIGNPAASQVADSVLTDVLMSAYRDIADKYDFVVMRARETIATVDGTRGYDLVTGVSVVRGVWDRTNKRRIVKAGDRTFWDDPQTEGKPEVYVRDGNQLLFFPTPDAVYSIEYKYKRVLTALVADGDTHILPETWEEGFLKLGRYKYYDDIAHDGAKAASANNSWLIWIADKPLEVAEEGVDLDSAVDPGLASSGPRLSWDAQD